MSGNEDGDPDRQLERAEADISAARGELAEAERDIEKAEAEVAEAEKEAHLHAFKVEVLYDGVKKPFEVRIEETVKTLLDKAIKAFGSLPNPHTLSLFTGGADGHELDDKLTIKQAGIEPCEVLLLRPSKVKGGK